MTDYTHCHIEQVSVHRIGNKSNEEALVLSKSPLDIEDDTLQDLLFRYFLKPFSDTEFYHFTFSDGDFQMNPLFNYAVSFFEESELFHETTQKVANHLYEVSNHPNIKSGDLFVTKFSGIALDDEILEAIGIFKAENKDAFLKLDQQRDDLTLNYDDGIHVDKLDKGCLIFNTSKSEGYKVTVVDTSNKLTEAQYWKDTFLNLKPCNDNYHSTKEFLNIAKTFVKEQVPDEFNTGKTDQIDLLNKSVDYFKSHDTFDKKEFEEKVFENDAMAESFRKFDDEYRTNNQVEIGENFQISSQALKKQSKGFKSVLKLDKNFHIYIHGDRSKIEQGVESDGRKYYKIYYDKER